MPTKGWHRRSGRYDERHITFYSGGAMPYHFLRPAALVRQMWHLECAIVARMRSTYVCVGQYCKY